MRRKPRRQRLTQEDLEERRREVGPLFAYCETHLISPYRLVLVARERYDRRPVRSRQWVHSVRKGESPAPWWLIRDSCRVLGLPMAEVMGPAWVAEFDEKYGLIAQPESSVLPSPSTPAA